MTVDVETAESELRQRLDAPPEFDELWWYQHVQALLPELDRLRAELADQTQCADHLEEQVESQKTWIAELSSASAMPELHYSSNGESGDGQNNCSVCGEERDTRHTYKQCAERLAIESVAHLDRSLELEIELTSERERHSAALAETKRHLQTLLARIHRDGGQYTNQHGLQKSVTAADLKVCQWLRGSE